MFQTTNQSNWLLWYYVYYHLLACSFNLLDHVKSFKKNKRTSCDPCSGPATSWSSCVPRLPTLAQQSTDRGWTWRLRSWSHPVSGKKNEGMFKMQILKSLPKHLNMVQSCEFQKRTCIHLQQEISDCKSLHHAGGLLGRLWAISLEIVLRNIYKDDTGWKFNSCLDRLKDTVLWQSGGFSGSVTEKTGWYIHSSHLISINRHLNHH